MNVALLLMITSILVTSHTKACLDCKHSWKWNCQRVVNQLVRFTPNIENVCLEFKEYVETWMQVPLTKCVGDCFDPAGAGLCHGPDDQLGDRLKYPTYHVEYLCYGLTKVFFGFLPLRWHSPETKSNIVYFNDRQKFVLP